MEGGRGEDGRRGRERGLSHSERKWRRGEGEGECAADERRVGSREVGVGA